LFPDVVGVLAGATLDVVLIPLKYYVSYIVEELLYMAGYPIARAGVVLNIGSYQLLIANACSGLNSMIALTSIGLLYVYLSSRNSFAHHAISPCVHVTHSVCRQRASRLNLGARHVSLRRRGRACLS
jgi:hypothetical protein